MNTFPEWVKQGLCAVNDPDLWFPRTKKEEVKAIGLCLMCPVRAQCLARALELPSGTLSYGVWAGYSYHYLKALKYKYGQGLRIKLLESLEG